MTFKFFNFLPWALRACKQTRMWSWKVGCYWLWRFSEHTGETTASYIYSKTSACSHVTNSLQTTEPHTNLTPCTLWKIQFSKQPHLDHSTAKAFSLLSTRERLDQIHVDYLEDTNYQHISLYTHRIYSLASDLNNSTHGIASVRKCVTI